MKNLYLSMFLLVIAFGFIGCAEITPPSPVDVLTHPFGKGPLAVGMTREKVVSMWGEPDDVVDLGANEWGAPREEWIYRARYPRVPIDVGYISRTKHLYFEGDVLTRWEDRGED